MAIHPRNEQYKDRIMSAPYEICVERARYFTESYRQTEGEHPALRAAKALEHTLRKMTLVVLDEEQILGNRTSKTVATIIPVERGDINTLLELDLDALTSRERQPYRIAPEDKRELLEDILPYWKGRTMRDRKKALWKANGLYFKPGVPSLRMIRQIAHLRSEFQPYKEDLKLPRGKGRVSYLLRGREELAYNNPANVMNVFDVQGHLILGVRNVLREGFAGIRAKAQQRLKTINPNDADSRAFLEAVILSCDAMKDFALRFAAHAEELAATATDAQRKRDLLAAAARCRRVPWQPPRDFREALQALWFTLVVALVAHGMPGIFAVGRLDQYLYPYYAKDKKARRITRAQAVEWMEELLIKLGSHLLMIPVIAKKTGSELGAESSSPTVGGVDRDGRDAVNELSYIVLDAFDNVRSLGNSFTIRLSPKSPPAFWRRALATYRRTSGAALFNDEIAVEALRGAGCSLPDARDYGTIGCVEPTSDGNTFGCTSGNDVSFTAALEMTLLNGELRMMGRRIGPATGDPRRFASFEEFLDACKKQLRFEIETVAKAVNLKDRAFMESFPCPIVSATLDGCVENARDMTGGGAQYNFASISGRGLGTTTDALAAIKHFVFDTRRISMTRMIRMIDDNFRCDEKTRVMLANKGPKYGCDDDRADGIAREVAEFFCREVAAQKSIRGGRFRPGFFSYGLHVLEGLFLGATPNGRRAGAPVSNSFSPANGSERKGPTAMLQSVAKIDARLIANGCALNMKLLPSLFEGEERLDKMVALVRTFFEMGGMELQPNVVSSQTLRAAQEHPDEYRDLVVRVSGYSALFCDLGRPLQNEIISRTEFGVLSS